MVVERPDRHCGDDLLYLWCFAFVTLASYLFVFWLNNTMIISSARQVFVSANGRVSIEGRDNDYILKIRNVQEYDDGNYSCQVPGGRPITQHNRLVVKSQHQSLVTRFCRSPKLSLLGSGKCHCIRVGRADVGGRKCFFAPAK